jgi:hypothetical protein
LDGHAISTASNTKHPSFSTLQAQEGPTPAPATSEGSPTVDLVPVPTPATLEQSPTPATTIRKSLTSDATTF